MSETMEADHSLAMAKETLSGDIRDFILDRLKHDHNPLPWNMRSEASQIETIEAVTMAVGRAVDRAVAIIAADGRKVIVAQLVQCAVKDGIRAVCEVAKTDERRHELIDSVGLPVLIAIADSAQFKGSRGDPAVSPDQGSILGDEEPEDDPGDNPYRPKPDRPRAGGRRRS